MYILSKEKDILSASNDIIIHRHRHQPDADTTTGIQILIIVTK